MTAILSRSGVGSPGRGVGVARTLGVLGGSVAALALLVAALPWLRGEDPARTVLRTRFAEREPDPAALASVRAELDLPTDPVTGALGWLAGALGGDLGRSWVSGGDVGPGVIGALGLSLTLATAAVIVAVAIAGAVLGPGVWRSSATGEPTGRGSGATAALLGSLPEPVLALTLIAVVAVGWGVLPTAGFAGPASLILPALALGVPAGGLLARIVSSALDATLAEGWTRSWRSAGYGRGAIATAAARRAVAIAIPQITLLLVGLLGTGVTIERAFAIPGLGSTALQAVLAQDIPVLQGCIAMLVVLGLSLGAVAALAHRTLLGPALTSAELPTAVPRGDPGPRRLRAVPWTLATLLAVAIAAGLLRDPAAVELQRRLAAPSAALPFGADELGRDLLARFGHGAVLTLGTALAVTALALAIGLTVGLLSRSNRAGVADVLNALPPVLVGILLAAVTGPGLLSAAIAVTAVGWIPLAVHTRGLVTEARASGYVRAAVLSGATPTRITRRHVLPAVLTPVLRHALVRIPHAALGIAALSFIGLGAGPESPEWGAMLADSLGYITRAPWTILAPAGGLATLGLIIGLLPTDPTRDPVQ